MEKNPNPTRMISGAVTPTLAPQESIRFYLFLALVVLAAALYANALRNPFVYDDHAAIVNQPDVQSRAGLRSLWFHDYLAGRGQTGSLYRPLTVLSFNLNNAVTGYVPKPAAFRLVNVILLGLVGCTAAWWLRGYVHRMAAFLATLVFVAHPVNVEAINYIGARAQLLAMLGLLIFLGVQRYTILNRRWSPLSAAIGFLAAALALGSGELGVLVLPLAIIQQWIDAPIPGRARRDPISAEQSARAWAWTLALVGVPFALYLVARVQVIGLFPTHNAGDQDLTSNPLWGLPLLKRIPPALSVTWFYCKQLVWPSSTFNHIPIELPTWKSGSVWAGLIMLLAVWAVGGVLAWRRHWLTVAAALAIGQHLLVAHLFVPGFVYAANSLAQPFVLALCAFIAWIVQREIAASARLRAMAVITCGAVVLAMSVLVFISNLRYRSEVEMRAQDNVDQPGNPVAYYNYSVALFNDQRYLDAAERLRQTRDTLTRLGRKPSAQVEKKIDELPETERSVARPHK